jgi:hypothetical protein
VLPPEPGDWDEPIGRRPELVFDGLVDEATGELVASLSVVLPAGSPAPRVERCARSGDGTGAIIAGVSGAALLGLGIGLLVDGANQPRATGMFSGLANLDTTLETAGGALALASGVVVAAIAIALAVPDEEDEAECSIDLPAAGAEVTTAPTTTPVENFVVRVIRPDGTNLVRAASGRRFRIPLEPALFACPGACLATLARRSAAGWPPESDLDHERLVVQAVAQGEMFGGDAVPLVSGIVDVTLMP